MTGRAQIAVRTHPGRVRATNEDAFAIDDALALVMVADGMGGEAGGEIAAHLACEAVLEAIAGNASFADAFAGADRAVREAAAARPSLLGMGATLVAVQIAGDEVSFAHVGDTRLYLLRRGPDAPVAAAPLYSPAVMLADAVLVCVTRDHSSIAELVERGHLDRAGGRAHPLRGRVNRAIGRGDSFEPATGSLARVHGDRLALCTDGLWEMVEDAEIARLLAASPSPADTCEALVAAALAAGGKDNVTVAVIDVA